jgi:hypothetical protein
MPAHDNDRNAPEPPSRPQTTEQALGRTPDSGLPTDMVSLTRQAFETGSAPQRPPTGGFSRSAAVRQSNSTALPFMGRPVQSAAAERRAGSGENVVFDSRQPDPGERWGRVNSGTPTRVDRSPSHPQTPEVVVGPRENPPTSSNFHTAPTLHTATWLDQQYGKARPLPDRSAGSRETPTPGRDAPAGGPSAPPRDAFVSPYRAGAVVTTSTQAGQHDRRSSSPAPAPTGSPARNAPGHVPGQ